MKEQLRGGVSRAAYLHPSESLYEMAGEQGYQSYSDPSAHESLPVPDGTHWASLELIVNKLLGVKHLTHSKGSTKC